MFTKRFSPLQPLKLTHAVRYSCPLNGVFSALNRMVPGCPALSGAAVRTYVATPTFS